MLYFIYGQETYLLKEALSELVFHLRRKNKEMPIEIKRIDQEKCDVKEIFEGLNNLELFNSFQIIILEQVFKNAQQIKHLLEKLPLPAKNYAVIILESGLPPKKSGLFNFLLERAKITKECRPIEGKELLAFAKKELGKHGLKAQDAVIAELVFRTGNDLWRLSREIFGGGKRQNY